MFIELAKVKDKERLIHLWHQKYAKDEPIENVRQMFNGSNAIYANLNDLTYDQKTYVENYILCLKYKPFNK